MNQAERAKEVIQTLAGLGYSAALVGGLAVSARSRERFTRDIDFAVAVASDQDSEGIGRAMQRLGYTLLTVLEQTTHGVISTLRFRHPQDSGHEPTVDLLCGATGIEQEIVAQATEVQISASTAVPVATVSHPIAMKSCLKTKTGIMTVATSKHCSRLHRLLKLKPLETR
ncbi:MAG: nucleotidyl transferase AbiEii/AbiGii toxin family protein [bacterium]|nr:nucleotidyl transferase AbiEii/AbiGii toxin family protein [bacterium]